MLATLQQPTRPDAENIITCPGAAANAKASTAGVAPKEPLAPAAASWVAVYTLSGSKATEFPGTEIGPKVSVLCAREGCAPSTRMISAAGEVASNAPPSSANRLWKGVEKTRDKGREAACIGTSEATAYRRSQSKT